MNTGTLPPGLSLGATTGVISGKPTQVGTFQFHSAVDRLSANDGYLSADCRSRSYRVRW